MSTSRVTDGLALLQRSADFTLDVLARVTPTDLSLATPCPGWDLGGLLVHLADSAGALHGLMTSGALAWGSTSPGPDPVVAAARAIRLLAAVPPAGDALCAVGDRGLWTSTALRCGAVEVALHGWDVARALGVDATLPDDLARALLGVARSMVLDATREPEFAPALPAGPGSTEQLVGFLGRR